MLAIAGAALTTHYVHPPGLCQSAILNGSYSLTMTLITVSTVFQLQLSMSSMNTGSGVTITVKLSGVCCQLKTSVICFLSLHGQAYHASVLTLCTHRLIEVVWSVGQIVMLNVDSNRLQWVSWWSSLCLSRMLEEVWWRTKCVPTVTPHVIETSANIHELLHFYLVFCCHHTLPYCQYCKAMGSLTQTFRSSSSISDTGKGGWMFSQDLHWPVSVQNLMMTIFIREDWTLHSKRSPTQAGAYEPKTGQFTPTQDWVTYKNSTVKIITETLFYICRTHKLILQHYLWVGLIGLTEKNIVQIFYRHMY